MSFTWTPSSNRLAIRTPPECLCVSKRYAFIKSIDAQTVDGLERHFRRGLGVPAELEEPEPLAHRTVLRQVAARLAHEPDGGVRHRRAARGAQERSIWK